MLNIDHHLGERALRRVQLHPRGRVLDRDVRAAACCARSTRAITPEIATCLLTTIMTDTGGFVHSNTTARTCCDCRREMMERGRGQGTHHQRDLREQAVGGGEAARAARSIGRGSRRDGRYCWSVVDDAMLGGDGRRRRRHRGDRAASARGRGRRGRGAVQGVRRRGARQLAQFGTRSTCRPLRRGSAAAAIAARRG